MVKMGRSVSYSEDSCPQFGTNTTRTYIFLYWICLFRFFCFYIDRLEIILGGEGGYLDWFLIRLLARDPPSEVGSMQR